MNSLSSLTLVVALLWTVFNRYIAVFIFQLGLTIDTPRKQLVIYQAMQARQFPAWFFETKLDNTSGHAAFYRRLREERIGNGIGRDSIGPRYSRTQAWATGQIA